MPKARVGGEHERGHSPSRKGVGWGLGDLPRDNFIFPDVRRDDFNALCDNLPLKRCLFYRFHYNEAMSWSIKPLFTGFALPKER